MEKLDEVLDLWKKDAEIDQTEPGRELLNIPKDRKSTRLNSSH